MCRVDSALVSDASVLIRFLLGRVNMDVGNLVRGLSLKSTDNDEQIEIQPTNIAAKVFKSKTDKSALCCQKEMLLDMFGTHRCTNNS